MLKINRIFLFSATLICCALSAQSQFRLSEGLYRIPYGNGTEVRVVTDGSNHDPLGCFDIVGRGGTGNYTIVAAAGGWIRAIRDNFNVNCHGSLPAPNNWCCGEFNNFIVLEHPNGEWSSYIHLAQNSITNLGHQVGDWVDVGAALGREGNVGCSTGPHLHLEISRPNDPNDLTPWADFDGVLRRDGELLNPVFCGTPSGTITSGSTYTAGNCSDNCPTNLTLTTASANDIRRADNLITSTATFNSGGLGVYRAGGAIELKAGFRATQGSRVTMKIRTCNQHN